MTDKEFETLEQQWRSFQWVHRTQQETVAMLAEAEELMATAGFEGSDTAPINDVDGWSFEFLNSQFYGLETVKRKGRCAFISATFHSGREATPERRAPYLQAGVIRWTVVDVEEEPNAELLWHAASDPTEARLFIVTEDGISRSVLSAYGREEYSNRYELEFLEVPLVWVSSRERLQDVVAATLNLVKGQPKLARDLVKEARTGDARRSVQRTANVLGRAEAVAAKPTIPRPRSISGVRRRSASSR